MDAPLAASAAVLQALAVPAYGLELLDRIRRNSAGLVRLRPGSLYPALRKLEGEGLVRVRRAPRRRSVGRPRRYYELTLRGVRTSMRQKQRIAAFFGARNPAPLPDPRLARERLRSCARVSALALKLRRRGQLARKASR